MIKMNIELRDKFNICGLPEDLRATSNAISYISGYMSEAEYIEMYNSGSNEYKLIADRLVSKIKKEFSA